MCYIFPNFGYLRLDSLWIVDDIILFALATLTADKGSGPTAEPAIVEIDDFGAPSPEER